MEPETMAAAVASQTCPNNSLESLGYVAAVFGILSLTLSYRLIYQRNGLDEQIAKKTAILKKLIEEEKKYEEAANRRRQEAAAVGQRLMSELKKTKEAVGSKGDKVGFSREYWDRIQTLGEMEEDPQLNKLMEEKAEVENMLASAKARYLELDEKIYKNIIEGYQSRLIEIETKIKKIRGRLDVK